MLGRDNFPKLVEISKNLKNCDHPEIAQSCFTECQTLKFWMK